MSGAARRPSAEGAAEAQKKKTFWDPVDIAEVLYTKYDLWYAACMIQNALYRGSLARADLHQRMKWLYVKEYDAYSGCFYYVNQWTGESVWTKPPNLHRTDLVSAHEHEAARRVQGMYRNWAVRNLLQKMFQHQYVKKVDAGTLKAFYIHKRSGESRWVKPVLLRNRDIMTPRTHKKTRKQRKEREKILAEKAAFKVQRDAIWDKQHIIVLEEKEKEKTKRRCQAIKELTHVVDHVTAIAKMTKDLNAAWMPLPRVPPAIFELGTTLRSLRMVGDDLVLLPMELRELSNLRVLNVSCNKLRELPDEICGLTHLKEINAMKNRLTHLPERIGDLHSLKSLELACNLLEHLPDSFGDLVRLPKINLELNQIAELPETLGRLGCKILNLNKNCLTTLPRCIGQMAHLESLHVNMNFLKFLPTELGSCPKMRELSLCNNDLATLPESLGDLEDTLEVLWLDWNRLSGLPWTFGKLVNLKQLKIEGNPQLCYPPLYVILEGVDKALAWCRARVDGSVISRRRVLVSTLQHCFEQLQKYDLAPLAHFEADVAWGDLGDRYYAFTSMDVIFDEFIPALKEFWASGQGSKNDLREFWYTKEQTLEAISLHVDANSAICEFDVPQIQFKRCDCHVQDASGKWVRRVCIPPRIGYNCKRSCLLLKDHIVRDTERAEQLLKQRERDAVSSAIEVARRDAVQWTKSQDANDFFKQKAIEKALAMAADERFDKFEASASKKADKQRDAIMRNFTHKRRLAARKRDNKKTRLVSKHSEIKIKHREEGIPYWEKEKCEDDMADIENEMADLEDDYKIELEKVDEDEEAALERWDARQDAIAYKEEDPMFAGLKLQMNPKQAARVKEFISTAKEDYVEEQVKIAKEEVEEEYSIMRRVMSNWKGMDVKVIFDGWKAWVRIENEKRHQAAKRARKRKELDHDGMLALVEMAEYECTQYDQKYDEFNDTSFYIHRATEEVVDHLPDVWHFLPDDFTLPVPPLTPRDQDQALARWNEHKLNIDEAPDEIKNALTTLTEQTKGKKALKRAADKAIAVATISSGPGSGGGGQQAEEIEDTRGE